ncbi:helix-turn-helix domain-containing protein [Cryobacterium cryoconiti]|nr:helix-turn-helix domain-containing protein [Cryobacterium cryoconiti]
MREKLREKCGDEMGVHEQLAGLLGATREATSKTMADFTARNLIRQGRGRIVIQDASALRVVARRTA